MVWVCVTSVSMERAASITEMPDWKLCMGRPVNGNPGAQMESVETKISKESRKKRGERRDLLP